MLEVTGGTADVSIAAERWIVFILNDLDDKCFHLVFDVSCNYEAIKILDYGPSKNLSV